MSLFMAVGLETLGMKCAPQPLLSFSLHSAFHLPLSLDHEALVATS